MEGVDVWKPSRGGHRLAALSEEQAQREQLSKKSGVVVRVSTSVKWGEQQK